MIFAGFSLIKLIGGFNILRGDKLGKILFNLFIIAVCLGVFYRVFVIPTSKTVIQKQVIEKQIVNEVEKKRFFGVNLFWDMFEVKTPTLESMKGDSK